MSLVCTHPGRYGDLLWALPTVRALAEANEPVTLTLSAKYAGMEALLTQQPYIASVFVDPSWDVQETAPMTPRVPILTANGPNCVHLGYRGWPSRGLPYEVYETVREEHPSLPLAPLALDRPWITPPRRYARYRDDEGSLTIGFTDEWFELKVGLTELVKSALEIACFPVVGSPRWQHERQYYPKTWGEAACYIAASPVFLGCCSALHVLAVALGVPAVVVEPNPQRHHPIFWPLGMEGPQVYCVKGGDGQPTFDARHTADKLREVLALRKG